MSYFLLYGIFALWVLFDGLSRRMGGSAVLWTAGTAILGPIILPIYLASRPLKQGELREGGKAWDVLKNFAVLWTVVMAVATIAGMMAMAKSTTDLTSDAARAGAGIGMVLGMGFLAAAWFFPTMGAALLGFLLKKNSIVETGPTGPLVGRNSTANAAGGWAGLVGVAVLGLIVMGVASNIDRTPSQSKSLVASSGTPKELPKTLGSFKRQFLSKDVIVNELPYEKKYNDVPYDGKYCLGWNSARQIPDGRYEEINIITNHLPIAYRGKTGTVVAVQVAKVKRTRVGGKDAFGKSVGEDDIDDPYMQVVVKFKDHTLAMTSGYTGTLVPWLMELASNRQSLKDDFESKLPSVIGRKLYAVHSSLLYEPTATIEELGRGKGTRVSVVDVPLLEPLTITKAKYLSDVNAVLMKVSLPNGTDAIVYAPSVYVQFSYPKDEFLSRISGALLTSIPRDLTSEEIQAIKGRKIFRGMSKDALDYAIGDSESENDWGRGGKQRIYFDGKLLVYLDSSGKVQDWQSFD